MDDLKELTDKVKNAVSRIEHLKQEKEKIEHKLNAAYEEIALLREENKRAKKATEEYHRVQKQKQEVQEQLEIILARIDKAS